VILESMVTLSLPLPARTRIGLEVTLDVVDHLPVVTSGRGGSGDVDVIGVVGAGDLKLHAAIDRTGLT